MQRYQPDTVIVYAGINDFAAYCQAPAQAGRAQRRSLVELKLPAQLLSVDLLVKNTTALREPPVHSTRRVDAHGLNLQRYAGDLDALFKAVHDCALRLDLAHFGASRGCHSFRQHPLRARRWAPGLAAGTAGC